MASPENRKNGQDNGRFLRIETLSGMSVRRRSQLIQRSSATYEKVRPLVERVVKEVARKGDAALVKYARRFDKANLPVSRIVVTEAEITKARKAVSRSSPDLMPAIKTMIECVRGYHEGELAQLRLGLKRWERSVGSSAWGKAGRMKVGQLRTPIDRVGVYVPGGNAVLLTTAVMAITPAKVAGVPSIVVASPPSRNGDIDPRIIVAADMAGADLIVRAGGAQAVAALAYGTKSVPRVAKIVGPGNVFVAAAKSYVAGTGICAIDFPAGPSEIVIIADDSAKEEYVARDMLSQSEHDSNASAVLVTTSSRVADGVRRRIMEELSSGKSPIAGRSLSSYGAILLADSISSAVAFANEFAPEHLEIMTKNPRALLDGIRNAGGIFLGPYSPVAIGDYVCPNHVLPTGGAARFSSGLSIDTFLKKPSFLEVPQSLIGTLDKLVETLSKAEGLYAQHGASVHARAR